MRYPYTFGVVLGLSLVAGFFLSMGLLSLLVSPAALESQLEEMAKEKATVLMFAATSEGLDLREIQRRCGGGDFSLLNVSLCGIQATDLVSLFQQAAHRSLLEYATPLEPLRPFWWLISLGFLALFLVFLIPSLFLAGAMNWKWEALVGGFAGVLLPRIFLSFFHFGDEVLQELLEWMMGKAEMALLISLGIFLGLAFLGVKRGWKWLFSIF